MRALVLAFALLIAVPVAAQIVSRPTDQPIVTAEHEAWYRLGDPVQFAGDLYFRAGPAVFFDGDTMVRTGYFNGVPLYADTTIEPCSIVYVPAGHGLMQPYERRRAGELAGTTGSRTPSFPVQTVSEAAAIPQAAIAPTGLPQRAARGSSAAEGALSGGAATITPAGAATTRAPVARAERPTEIATAIRPHGNDGIWIEYQGRKWISAGGAAPFQPREFERVGSYAGFPVYVKHGADRNTIYVPSRPGLVAPYRKK